MTMLRVVLILVWAVLIAVTVQAVGAQGLGAAGDIFFADLRSGTWHAQFGVDFAGHLILMALWVCWRHCFSPLGWVFGLLCIMGGGLFSFAYLTVVSFKAGGDIKKLLLGRQYQAV